MKTAATVVQMLVRAAGVIQVILGALFWAGSALALIPVHMLVGLLLVIGLWVMAGLGARAGVGAGLVIVAVVWGLIVPVLGVMQTGLLAGDFHWLIQIIHLLVGLAAVGLSERLAKGIKGGRRAGRDMPGAATAAA
jgi:hypothetical protein